MKLSEIINQEVENEVAEYLNKNPGPPSFSGRTMMELQLKIEIILKYLDGQCEEKNGRSK